MKNKYAPYQTQWNHANCENKKSSSVLKSSTARQTWSKWRRVRSLRSTYQFHVQDQPSLSTSKPWRHLHDHLHMPKEQESSRHCSKSHTTTWQQAPGSISHTSTTRDTIFITQTQHNNATARLMQLHWCRSCTWSLWSSSSSGTTWLTCQWHGQMHLSRSSTRWQMHAPSKLQYAWESSRACSENAWHHAPYSISHTNTTAVSRKSNK